MRSDEAARSDFYFANSALAQRMLNSPRNPVTVQRLLATIAKRAAGLPAVQCSPVPLAGHVARVG